MQKKSYTIGSLIILLICAFVFVIVPVLSGSSKTVQDSPVVGKYDGTEIRYTQDSDFANAVSNYASMLQNQGQTLDINNSFYVYTYAFNATVAQMAYAKAVENSGYVVSEPSVNRELAGSFIDENGNYSDVIYRKYLNDNPSGLNELRAGTKKMLVSTRYLNDLYGDDNFFGEKKIYGLKSSDAELDFLAKMNTEKRGFEVTSFNMNDYPTEEKVAFGKANASKFVKYDLSVITTADEATAKKVLDRINKGEITFEDAVSEYSTKKFSGSSGSFYYAYNYQLENILAKDASASDVTNLKAGDISPVIPTVANSGNGEEACWSIFRSNADSVTPDFEDESTLNSVFNYIYSREKSILEDYYTDKCNELLTKASETDLESACAELGATYGVMDPIPLNYGSATVAECVDIEIAGLETADTNDNFWKTAFSLGKDQWSSPVVLEDCLVLLHYTSDETTSVDDNYIAPSEVRDIDQSVGNSELMASPKVENKVMDFVFSNLNL